MLKEKLISPSIIFLDVDGVLNTTNDDLNTLNNDALNLIKLLCDTTKSKVVLTSMWRLDPKRVDLLKNTVIGPYFHQDFKTDECFSYKNGILHSRRGNEIQEWLSRNKSFLFNYIIIDDTYDFYHTQNTRIVKTNPKEGFTNKKYIEAYSKLVEERDLFFYYGGMASGKSAKILEYQNTNSREYIFTRKKMYHNDIPHIESRNGLKRDCHFFNYAFYEFLSSYPVDEKIKTVIIDEAQFLTKSDVDLVVDIVDKLGYKTICYGLKTSYTGELFEGSAKLLAVADVISSFDNTNISKKNEFHIKYVDGIPVFSGDMIEVGREEKYKTVSRKEWRLLRGDFHC